MKIIEKCVELGADIDRPVKGLSLNSYNQNFPLNESLKVHFRDLGSVTLLDYVEMSNEWPSEPNLQSVFQKLIFLGADINAISPFDDRPLFYRIFRRISRAMKGEVKIYTNFSGKIIPLK